MYTANIAKAFWADFPAWLIRIKVLTAKECLKLWGTGALKMVLAMICRGASSPAAVTA